MAKSPALDVFPAFVEKSNTWIIVLAVLAFVVIAPFAACAVSCVALGVVKGAHESTP